MTTLPPQTRLKHGDYTIHDTAGSPGGFGITYRASWVSMTMEVAIKELFVADDSHLCSRIPGNRDIVTGHEKQGLFREYIDKFKDEARRLFDLHHENVVRVHDFFEENNTAYIVMEYLPGESLADLVFSKRTLSERDALAIMEPLCKCVATLHQKGILHRDISPENILFRDAFTPVLIDFGLAREQVASKSKTVAAFRAGYSPLEAYTAEGAREKQSDIYSLGAVLYFMVIGKDPPAATELAQGAEKLRFPQSLSAQMQAAITKAMRIKISDRFASAAELLQALSSPEQKPRAQTSKECSVCGSVMFGGTCFNLQCAPRLQKENPQKASTITFADPLGQLNNVQSFDYASLISKTLVKKCAHAGCDNSPKSGGKYCYTHSCMSIGCNNPAALGDYCFLHGHYSGGKQNTIGNFQHNRFSSSIASPARSRSERIAWGTVLLTGLLYFIPVVPPLLIHFSITLVSKHSFWESSIMLNFLFPIWALMMCVFRGRFAGYWVNYVNPVAFVIIPCIVLFAFSAIVFDSSRGSIVFCNVTFAIVAYVVFLAKGWRK